MRKEIGEEEASVLQRTRDYFRKKRTLKQDAWERNDAEFLEQAAQFEIDTAERRLGRQIATR